LFWQLAALMHKAERDYIVIERNAVAGSFFLQYPRHRVLNGINRVNTGSDDPEVNLLHDWHSLLLDDPELRFGKYSSEFYPKADDLVRYLSAVVSKLKLNVVFNTNVQSIEKPPGAGSSFQIRTSSSSSNASSTTFSHYKCKYTIMANGLSEPKKLKPDKEAVIFGYESMPMDKAWYNGKSVYILGAGNSALETALHIERCCVLCCAVCVFLQRAA
jgi:hypothetical protein